MLGGGFIREKQQDRRAATMLASSHCGRLRLMTKSVAVQHAKDNIRANSVHPGIMPPMRTSGRTADPAVRCERMRVVPMRRPGEVDDVAPFCSWLPMNRPTSPVRKSTSTAEFSPYRPAPPHRRLSTPIAAVPWYAIGLPGSTQSGPSRGTGSNADPSP